jgi:hypothetical protein
VDEVERQVAERGEWGEWRGGQAKVDRGMADTDHRNFDGWGRQPHQVRPVWPLSSQVRCVHRGGRGADWQDAEWWRWRGGAGRNGPRHTTRRPSPEIRRGCCCCCRAGRLPPRALARTHAHADPLSRPLLPPLPSLHTAKGEWAADCASCQQLCGEFNVRAIRQRLLLQSRMPPPLRARTRTHAHTDPLFHPLLLPLPFVHTTEGEWAADRASC